MGQTDKQFSAFLRLIIGRLKCAKAAPTLEEIRASIDDIIEDLRSSLED